MIWCKNFTMKRVVNGEEIVVGPQNFTTGTILVKDARGNELELPMFQDIKGDIYFMYNGVTVYVSTYV